ncbi:MAG: hypothetical protein H0V62_11785 [Gammaproteobacteria bacterium]|nr:hypothetical protein [Gammaproteobacteria bacterium]
MAAARGRFRGRFSRSFRKIRLDGKIFSENQGQFSGSTTQKAGQVAQERVERPKARLSGVTP